MEIFPQFHPVAPMPQATVDHYGQQVPPEIAAMWARYGAGFVGDGFLRVIDPLQFIEDGGIYLRSGVPVFTTALCDTIMFIPETSSFTAMKLRWGAMDIVSPIGAPVSQSLAAFADPAFQWQVLESRHYREAAARTGVPDMGRGFNYVPMLALGGPHRSDTLDEGSLVVSQSLLVQVDPPKLRCYSPDQVQPREDY